jgi:hypothetical protein
MSRLDEIVTLAQNLSRCAAGASDHRASDCSRAARDLQRCRKSIISRGLFTKQSHVLQERVVIFNIQIFVEFYENLYIFFFNTISETV